jgi:hypothetical protein
MLVTAVTPPYVMLDSSELGSIRRCGWPLPGA